MVASVRRNEVLKTFLSVIADTGRSGSSNELRSVIIRHISVAHPSIVWVIGSNSVSDSFPLALESFEPSVEITELASEHVQRNHPYLVYLRRYSDMPSVLRHNGHMP